MALHLRYQNIQMMQLILLPLLLISVHTQAYFATCGEDAGRQCGTPNKTDFILNIKKGGSEILSNQVYLYDFFLCEQYNYDCGYLPDEQSPITIADGVSLSMNQSHLNQITSGNTALFNKIKPYLGKAGSEAKCGMGMFPLTLTSSESKQVLDGYMQVLKDEIKSAYNAERGPSTQVWSDININIRTAMLGILKSRPNLFQNSELWDKFVVNDFKGVSQQIKSMYAESADPVELHEAYLIDSVTSKCNKLQSVNFLVDESGSIGPTAFGYAKSFLQMYLNQTNDDFTKMSINFYSWSYTSYLSFGNDKASLIAGVRAKPYLQGFTYTATAIRQHVDEILAQGFGNGLPKVLIVMTDGAATDSVNLPASAKYAQDNGIVCIAVGIGANVSYSQLEIIAGNPSNIILIDKYEDLQNLVEFIGNYFCKQMMTLEVDQSIENNFVREPESPSYFRVIKSQENEYYKMDIDFESDPLQRQEEIYESQIDPFPDKYTEYQSEIYTDNTLESVTQPIVTSFRHKLTASAYRKVMFIEPSKQIQFNIKKTIYGTMISEVSYVAVRGNNLGFNLSLKRCATASCENERLSYRLAASILIPGDEDYSIFLVIGLTLASMALCCLFFLFGFRRCREEEQKKKKQDISSQIKQSIMSENVTQENIAQLESKQAGEQKVSEICGEGSGIEVIRD